MSASKESESSKEKNATTTRLLTLNHPSNLINNEFKTLSSSMIPAPLCSTVVVFTILSHRCRMMKKCFFNECHTTPPVLVPRVL